MMIQAVWNEQIAKFLSYFPHYPTFSFIMTSGLSVLLQDMVSETAASYSPHRISYHQSDHM